MKSYSILPNVIYRHDNAPHKAWRTIATYPQHFHNVSEKNVIANNISSQPSVALREFCSFVLQTLRAESRNRK